ncbi:unnamed protein product [Kuraishia capsulata CBS 1993]|uniref:CFEM domain-containing protein n=1 Tax=Kuraishia capsulata CBS 1993 TaxID=1382522 RepID=W6MIP9_9ASCO|nr:uncharacterized protein KUCA_T00000217001 [Kuraishia capsulata CBS 1993]CDK24257.1 unnamed protein product [Kuraishia capsulata CBS 1993]
MVLIRVSWFIHIYLVIPIVLATPPACVLSCVNEIAALCPRRHIDFDCYCTDVPRMVGCLVKACPYGNYLSARDHFLGVCEEFSCDYHKQGKGHGPKQQSMYSNKSFYDEEHDQRRAVEDLGMRFKDTIEHASVSLNWGDREVAPVTVATKFLDAEFASSPDVDYSAIGDDFVGAKDPEQDMHEEHNEKAGEKESDEQEKEEVKEKEDVQGKEEKEEVPDEEKETGKAEDKQQVVQPEEEVKPEQDAQPTEEEINPVAGDETQYLTESDLADNAPGQDVEESLQNGKGEDDDEDEEVVDEVSEDTSEPESTKAGKHTTSNRPTPTSYSSSTTTSTSTRRIDRDALAYDRGWYRQIKHHFEPIQTAPLKKKLRNGDLSDYLSAKNHVQQKIQKARQKQAALAEVKRPVLYSLPKVRNTKSRIVSNADSRG